MKATIYSHNIIIGSADLQVGDESMGCVFGQFFPNEYYFNNIQKKVWEFWANNKPDYIKWYSLRFNVKLDNGFFLFPCGGYTIDDILELPNEPKRIDIGGINLDIFKLKTNSLLEPWSELTIEQKITFEDELNREITPVKSFFDFLSKKENHKLFGAQISAFAKYGPNDDVLFEVIKDGEDSRLVVVHLTWISRKKEHLNHFPNTRFYLDYNDFEQKRMKLDTLEWNA
jgi:hypothetical protein